MNSEDIKAFNEMTLGVSMGDGKPWGECRKEADTNGLDWVMVKFHAGVEYEKQQRMGANSWN